MTRATEPAGGTYRKHSSHWRNCSLTSPFCSTPNKHIISLILTFVWVALIDCAPMRSWASETRNTSFASDLKPHQALARDIFEELVEIDTTDRSGDNTAAANAMAKRLIAVGFPKKDVQVLAPAPRKGNLVARLRGTQAELKPLVLLAHLDVVDADQTLWTRSPFTFVEEDGYYYGRGTSDDKDEAAIDLANIIRLKREGFQPKRDIVVVLTADEEGGEHNGVKWLLETHPDLLDAEYVISEGGGGVLIGGEQFSNEFQVTEKRYQTFLLEAKSPGGHSSMPTDDNAIFHASAALQRIREYRFPLHLSRVTTLMFSRYSTITTGALSEAMKGVLQSPPSEKAINYLSKDPFYNAMMRTTCVPTMIEGGHAENALPQHVMVTVNCRILPTDSNEFVRKTLETVVAGEGVSLRPARGSELGTEVETQSEIELRPDVMSAIETASKSMWPDVAVVPIMTPGGTDNKYLRQRGISVYGVNGIFIDVEDDRGHAKDERLRVSSFFEGQEFLYRLTRELSQSK